MPNIYILPTLQALEQRALELELHCNPACRIIHAAIKGRADQRRAGEELAVPGPLRGRQQWNLQHMYGRIPACWFVRGRGCARGGRKGSMVTSVTCPHLVSLIPRRQGGMVYSYIQNDINCYSTRNDKLRVV